MSSVRAAMTPRARRIAAWSAVVLALALVFAAWADPHLAREFAAQVWACF